MFERMKYYILSIVVFLFLATGSIAIESETTATGSTTSDYQICYTDHNNYNETTCFDPEDYDASSSNANSQEKNNKGVRVLSNITADSLLSILNSTENIVFVIFYDNSTLFASKFIYSFEHAVSKLYKTNLNILFATMRKHDEPLFAHANNINNDVDLRVFIPGYERLKLPFEYSLRILNSLKEPERQSVLTRQLNEILFRLDGKLSIFNDYLKKFYKENKDSKNNDDTKISTRDEVAKNREIHEKIKLALSNILYEYDMGQRNHDKSNQNESDEKIRLSMIKETASLYIGQLHLYYKAKKSGLNELIKLFTKFHSSLRLNKCGSVNTCLSTYKKVKVTQQLLNVLFSEDNDQLDTVCHVAKYLKENEQNKLDALKKIEGIPTLEEINQIEDPLRIVELLKQMDTDEKQCKIDLLQKEEDVITMMYDTLGQRESQTKQRLHMVRTTTDRGAKPTQQQGRIYQQYAQKYSSCKLYGKTIKDLNTIYDKVNKKNNAKKKKTIDYAQSRQVPDM